MDQNLQNISAYSQSDGDILLKFSGQSTTIRKFRDNNPMYYSEKNNKLITYKEEQKMYTDSILFGKAKAKQEPAKIDKLQHSYYPSIQKIVNMEDTRIKTEKALLLWMRIRGKVYEPMFGKCLFYCRGIALEVGSTNL